MGLMDFFSHDAGQARRKWLDDKANGLVEFVPPELRPWLALGNELNPVTSIERAGQGAQRVADPNVQGWDKVAAVGDTASNMAGFVAPIIAASKGAVPAANAVEDALMGWSQSAGVPQFVTDESGALRVYHGSPHDFDRFSMDKIGTGEGAQAYGHGLYFAENEGVAKEYRDSLSAKAAPKSSGNVDLQELYQNLPTEPDTLLQARRDFRSLVEQGAIDPADRRTFFDLVRQNINAAKGGKMYEVQINANPEDFLDWDKPLSEQPKAEAAVGRYLERSLDQPGPINEDVFKRFESGQMRGEDVARLVGQDTAPLRDAGIPGIRYLDAGSRSAGDGSRNYVVFDENLISILRKYGLIPGAIGAGAYGMQPNQAQAGE